MIRIVKVTVALCVSMVAFCLTIVYVTTGTYTTEKLKVESRAFYNRLSTFMCFCGASKATCVIWIRWCNFIIVDIS